MRRGGGIYAHNTLRANLKLATFAPRDEAGRITSEKDVIISGHLSARDALHRLLAARPVAVILRESLERLLSHYYFLKSYEPNSLKEVGSPIASRLNESGLSEVARDPGLLAFFKDHYLRRLDPEWDHESQRKPCAYLALEFLKGRDMVGVTSRMEWFIGSIEKLLGASLHHKDRSIYGNRRDQLTSMYGFRKIKREEVSTETIKLPGKATRIDRMIYGYALSRCI